MQKFIDYWLLQENAAPRSYSCLMLDCEELLPQIKAIQSNIKDEDVYDEEEGHGLEDEPHITVLYGIHEQSPQLVKDQMDLYPVTYKLTELSLFENEEYDVLKCSVESEGLHTLNKQAKELEHTSNFPDYIPHLTVAYLNPGEGKKYLKLKSPIFGKELESDRFIFSDKDGNQTKWTIEG